MPDERSAFRLAALAPLHCFPLGVAEDLTDRGRAMIHSMTAFASRTGTTGAAAWGWEVRSVNGRGLDLRLRLPDGIDGLEADIRKLFTGALKRGTVSLSLRLTQEGAEQVLDLDVTQLDRVLAALDHIQERAFAMGVTLGQPTAADVLNQRGVVRHGGAGLPDAALIAALKADIAPLLTDLIAMRVQEGAALHRVVAGQLDEIASLLAQAESAAAARRPEATEAFQAALARVVDQTAIDPDRLAQEMAVLAVKTDVTEEIDRLKTHVVAARALLETAQTTDQDQPIGRKLDFLSQEFNREANTLCAKSQNPALTAIGLDLKTVIDQMREQIQNVE